MEFINIYGGPRNSGDILRAPLINLYSTMALPQVWRATTFIADNLASLPWFTADNGVAISEPHPLEYILNQQANPTVPAFEFHRRLFTDAVHRQSAFAFIKRDPETYAVTGLYNLDACDVTPYVVYDDPEDFTTASYWYWHAPSKRPLAAADIIHVKGNAGCAGSSIEPHNPAWLHRQTFETAALIEMRTARAMRRGTSIIGAVEIPDQPTEEAKQEIIDTVKQFSAPNAERDVLLLTGGAKLNNQALTPADLQLKEQRIAITKQIAQIYGIDPVYLFDRSESQYSNNAEQTGQDVTRFTLRLWMENVESEFSFKLLSTPELRRFRTLEMNADALLRGDAQTQAVIANSTVNGGLATPNEGRRELGLPDDPNPESDQLRNPTHLASSTPPPQGDSK